jgi:hypothetical protein
MSDTAYDRAITYATDRGARDGRNAAEWYVQGTLAERVRDPRLTAAIILRGVEDGDPAVLDTFPYADLSGEWADTLTGPQLVEDAIVNADDWSMQRDAWRAYWASMLTADQDICDAYEEAYAAAAAAEIERAVRAILAD